MISSSSTLASSQPATSWNVTLGVSPESSFAFDLPNAKARLPPCWTCRKKKIHSAIRITHGRNWNRSVPNEGFGSLAEIGTSCSSSR